ncbi:MAG: CpsB/CapC family capsule biosynthesis tyrosine phosphatase [Planctomycetota bacterium]
MKNEPTPTNQSPAAPPPRGRIDIHSHMLPGIDDGCADVEESLTSVRALIEHSYSATICTPHCWPDLYPHITPQHIAAWVDDLQAQIDQAGLGYQLYPGGELRIHPGAVEWMARVGVPTLVGSMFVLCDFWEAKWHKWIDSTFDWLLAEGYTPILAHPERSPTKKDFDEKVDAWAARGVLLQGNFRCFTGEEGFHADTTVRRYMDQDRYTFLALDMHRPEALPGRLDGVDLAIQGYGKQRIQAMTDARVRELIFNSAK